MRHVREEVEDLYWKADGLCRLPTVSEFTIQIWQRPEDDPNEESSSESSSGEDTTSDTSDYYFLVYNFLFHIIYFYILYFYIVFLYALLCIFIFFIICSKLHFLNIIL